MENNRKIPAIKIQQNDKDILIFTLSAKVLFDVCYFNPREQDRQSGLQRQFKIERGKQIAEYIDSEDSVLPNDIIINLELDKLGLGMRDIYNEKSKLLDLDKMIRASSRIKNPKLRNKIAFVIDGQHRLRAFEYVLRNKDFPLVVAALIDLTIAEIAEIFVKINYYQIPVNKSLVFDLLGISRKIFPEYFHLHKIVEKLNDDIASPFYGKIKMLGIGKGFISQASMITAIENYKIEKTLKNMGITPSEEVIYNVIWNFFEAVSNAFPNHWVEGSRLSKTIGIRALFLIMRDLLELFSKTKTTFSVKEIESILKKFDMAELLSQIEGLGGEKGVKMFHSNMKKLLNNRNAN